MRFSGTSTPLSSPRRPRRLHAVLALFALVGSLGVATAQQAVAETTVAASVEVRGAGGNCLTREAEPTSGFIAMRPCTEALRFYQEWDIVNFGTAFGSQSGLSIPLMTSTGLARFCLGTGDDETASGSYVGLEACDPSVNPSVQWLATDLRYGVPTKIRSYQAGRCLDVRNAGTVPGTAVWLYDCNDESDAQTFIIGTPDYEGPVVNNRADKGAGSMCLTAPSGIPAQGDLVTIEECTGAARQRWVELAGYFMLGGKCLDIRGADASSGTSVQLYTCVEVPQQRWRDQDTGVLKSDLADVCLDVAYGATTPGSLVWSYACNGTHAQGWYHGDLPKHFVSTGALAAQLNAAMASQLTSCSGMLSLTRDDISVVAAVNPAAAIVQRSEARFSDDALSVGAGVFGNRAAINGQWFNEGGDLAYVPQGDIWVAGQQVNANPYDANYHGYNITVPATGECGHQWSIGPQDNSLLGERPYPDGAPPDGFAMGGTRPMIINGAEWGPGTDLDWPTNEKWSYYESRDGGHSNGKVTVGVRRDGMVMFIVQRDAPVALAFGGKSLTEIRDAYALLGFQDAVLFDSRSSATLAVNGSLLAAPADYKEKEIPAGLVMGNN